MERAEMTFTVTAEDTAEALGSGDLPVLGTPRLLAWCEAATCEAARTALQPGQTTVGSRIALQHLRPTPLGDAVTVHATPLGSDGRMLRFEVRATDARGAIIATGEVTRAVVDAERFLARSNADRDH